jgi:hypothetical protein
VCDKQSVSRVTRWRGKVQNGSWWGHVRPYIYIHIYIYIHMFPPYVGNTYGAAKHDFIFPKGKNEVLLGHRSHESLLQIFERWENRCPRLNESKILLFFSFFFFLFLR